MAGAADELVLALQAELEAARSENATLRYELDAQHEHSSNDLRTLEQCNVELRKENGRLHEELNALREALPFMGGRLRGGETPSPDPQPGVASEEQSEVVVVA